MNLRSSNLLFLIMLILTIAVIGCYIYYMIANDFDSFCVIAITTIAISFTGGLIHYFLSKKEKADKMLLSIIISIVPIGLSAIAATIGIVIGILYALWALILFISGATGYHG